MFQGNTSLILPIHYIQALKTSAIEDLVIKLDYIFKIQNSEERCEQLDEIKDEVLKTLASEEINLKETLLIKTLFQFCEAKKHGDRFNNTVDILSMLVRQTDISKVHACALILNPNISDEIVRWAKKLQNLLLIKELRSFSSDDSNFYEFFKAEIHANLSNPTISETKFIFSLKLALKGEHEENLQLLLSHIHPYWHRSLSLTKILFNHEVNLSSEASDTDKHNFQRLIGITSNSLLEAEDPRRSSLLKEIISAPFNKDELRFVLTSILKFQEKSAIEYAWVVDGIKELLTNLKEFRSLASDIARLLFFSGNPETFNCLKDVQRISKHGSEPWLISTISLAARGDQISLIRLDKGIFRKPILSQININNESIEEIICSGIKLDNTGDLTIMLWQQITSYKIFSEKIIATIAEKTLNSEHLIPREKIQSFMERLLEQNKLNSRTEYENVKKIINFSIDLSLQFKDEVLAHIVRQDPDSYFNINTIYKYLLHNFDVDYPHTYSLISEFISNEDKELILEAKNQLLPSDKLHHCLFAEEGVLLRNFDLFIRTPNKFPDIFTRVILSDNYPDQLSLLKCYEDPKWKNDFLCMLSDSAETLMQNGDFDASNKIKSYHKALLDAEDLGITKPFRLLPSQLIEVVRVRQTPLKHSASTKIAIFSSRADHNYAFRSASELISKYTDAGYCVVYYEITDKYHLAEVFDEYKNEFKTASTIWISAHSNNSMMQYTVDKESLNLRNSDIQIFRELGLSDVIESNGQLIIDGCSTKQKVHGGLSISGCFEFLLSTRPDVNIAASRFTMSYFDVNFSVDEFGLLKAKYPLLPIEWNIV